MKEQQKDERAMVIVETEDNRALVSAESSPEVGVVRRSARPRRCWPPGSSPGREAQPADPRGLPGDPGSSADQEVGLAQDRRRLGSPTRSSARSGASTARPARPARTSSGRSAVARWRQTAATWDAVGSCASNERRFAHIDHDVRAIAHTRSKNRAVADLVGGGEVSAEEIEGRWRRPCAARRGARLWPGLRRDRCPLPGDASQAVSRRRQAAPPAPPSRDEAASDAQLGTSARTCSARGPTRPRFARAPAWRPSRS